MNPVIGYWLASRCIHCNVNAAWFDLRVIKSNLCMSGVYGSGEPPSDGAHCVCPIVYIPASVEVTISPSTDTSEYHKTVPHVVK